MQYNKPTRPRAKHDSDPLFGILFDLYDAAFEHQLLWDQVLALSS